MNNDFLKKVTDNQGIIHKVCRIYCNESEDRKDLFQEILTQLWHAYPTFKGQAKFTTWMYRVALNTAITYFKKSKRIPKTRNSLEGIEIAEEYYDYETEEQLKDLYKAIEKLSGIEKSIILLYLEEKKYEEIAEITGITQNYVRVKMNRIKEKLRTIMNPATT